MTEQVARGSTPKPSRPRHLRQLRRRTDALHRDVRIAVTKLDLLDLVGSVALGHLSALSAREADLGQAYPTGAERFQYVIDKITQAMASEVDALAESWATSR